MVISSLIVGLGTGFLVGLAVNLAGGEDAKSKVGLDPGQSHPVLIPQHVEGVNEQIEPYDCIAYWWHTVETAEAWNERWPNSYPKQKFGDVRDEFALPNQQPVWAYDEHDATSVFVKAFKLQTADEIECRRASCYMECDTQQVPAGSRRVYFSSIDPIIGSPVSLDSNERGYIAYQCGSWAAQCDWKAWRDVDIMATGWCPRWCKEWGHE